MGLVPGYNTLNSIILHFSSFLVNENEKSCAHQYPSP